MITLGQHRLTLNIYFKISEKYWYICYPPIQQRQSTESKHNICGHWPSGTWDEACCMKGLTYSTYLCPAVATGIHTHLRPIRKKKKKIPSEFVNP